MKGNSVEDNGEFYNLNYIPLTIFIKSFLFLDNESTSDDSMLSNDKTQGKYSNIQDKFQKKGHQTKVHSSHRSLSRFEL